MDDIVTNYAEGTVGYRVYELFRNAASKGGFENVLGGTATNKQLTKSVKTLWTTTERSLHLLIEAVGNPESPPPTGTPLSKLDA